MNLQPYKYSRRLWAALLAEFIGMAIFQIYGGSANDEVAAFGNGLTLAVVSETFSHSSAKPIRPPHLGASSECKAGAGQCIMPYMLDGSLLINATTVLQSMQ